MYIYLIYIYIYICSIFKFHGKSMCTEYIMITMENIRESPL